MSKNCGNVKNPCKICFNEVTKKTGLQCQGACKKWVHYDCLNYTPGKILDIQKGFITVLCPCPGCDKGMGPDLISWEKLPNKTVESCSKKDCPSNSLTPTCIDLECNSFLGICPPCPHCPITKQIQKSPRCALPTFPKCDGNDGPDTQPCCCKKPLSTPPRPPKRCSKPSGNGLTLTVIGSRQKCDKKSQSCPSQESQPCVCAAPHIKVLPCPSPKPSPPPKPCPLPKMVCRSAQPEPCYTPEPCYPPEPCNPPKPCCKPKPGCPMKPGCQPEPCCQPKPLCPLKPSCQPESWCTPEPCCQPEPDCHPKPTCKKDVCCQPQPRCPDSGCPPKPCDLDMEDDNDMSMRETVSQLGATVEELSAKVDELMTQIQEP